MSEVSDVWHNLFWQHFGWHQDYERKNTKKECKKHVDIWRKISTLKRMSSRNNRDALITRHGYDHLHGCRSFPSPSRGHSWKPSAKECLGAAIPSECSECFADSMPILCCLKLLQSDVYLVYLVKSCEFKSWNHAKSWIVLLKEVSIPTFAT